MRRRSPKQRTVLDQLIKSLGTLDALRTATFVTAWAVADKRREDQDKPLTREDYSSYWKCSVSTTARDLARFRSAFPMFTHPTGLIEYMRERGCEPGLVTFDRVAWEPEKLAEPEPEA